MGRLKYVIGGALIGVVGVSYGSWRLSVRQRFKTVFSGLKSGLESPDSFDRAEEKKELKDLLSNNPQGIILVTGKIGAGKSNIITNVLKNKTYVAQFNWRDKPTFKEEKELEQSLEKGFMFNKWRISAGLLAKVLGKFFGEIELPATPNIYENIFQFMGQINGVALLKKDRPIIWIDEIKCLYYLIKREPEVAARFFQFLISISKVKTIGLFF